MNLKYMNKINSKNVKQISESIQKLKARRIQGLLRP
jgi:hypothetical protein